MSQNRTAMAMSELLDRLRGDQYPRELVTQVSDLLTSDHPTGDSSAEQDRPAANQHAADFFAQVVEPLCDSFSPSDAAAYNKLMSQVVDHCSREPRAARVSKELTGFGLARETDILSRVNALYAPIPSNGAKVLRNSAASVRRCIVLSRVTLGADVAITSVIIDRLESLCPNAEIFMLGSAKLRELFGGDSRVTVVEVEYRPTDVLQRLLGWAEALDQIRELSADIDESELLILDPDSRLTQLGVLPLAHNAAYLFFPSRTYKHDSNLSLAHLTSQWLDEISGKVQPTLPRICLRKLDIDKSAAAVSAIRRRDPAPVVTINFGVGNNTSKRVGNEFEAGLVRAILEQGMQIILDCGVSTEERVRASRVVVAARESFGESIAVTATEHTLEGLRDNKNSECRLLMWSGRAGMLAGMIASSDLYAGYDSAGQHIAAALGVPCIDIFSGAPSERFRDRWTPTGPGECTVVTTGGKTGSEILAETLSAAHKALGGR
jgi:hypothetical protein